MRALELKEGCRMSFHLDVENLEDLASALRQLRRRHARKRNDSELTYRELASKSGYSRGMIGDYFSGKTLPPTDRLDVLMTLLEASSEELSALATARDRIEERLRHRSVLVPRQLPVAIPELPFDLPLVAKLCDDLGPKLYCLTRKSLHAVIVGGESHGRIQRRRDAELIWTVEIVNTSSRLLTQVEVPLAGEVPVEDGELRVRISFPTYEMVCDARVREQPGFTPTLALVMPHPGLAPGTSISLHYAYTW